MSEEDQEFTPTIERDMPLVGLLLFFEGLIVGASVAAILLDEGPGNGLGKGTMVAVAVFGMLLVLVTIAGIGLSFALPKQIGKRWGVLHFALQILLLLGGVAMMLNEYWM